MNPYGMGHAHGKVIWFGEHAVVYHHPAIALPLKTAVVQVKMTPSDSLQFISPFYQGTLDDAPHLEGFSNLFVELKRRLPLGNVTIELTTDIPVQGGLGASAAIASAMVQAAYDLTDQPLEQGTRYELTQISEKFFHQNPSGIDAFMSMAKTAQRYRKEQAPSALDLTLDGELVVVYSNVPGNTKDAIIKIAKATQKTKLYTLMADLGHLSEDALEAILGRDLNLLGRLMNQAHQILNHFEISHPSIETLRDLALNQGALGAKLSGGGLGGIMIALFDDPNKATSYTEQLQEKGYLKYWRMPLKESHD